MSKGELLCPGAGLSELQADIVATITLVKLTTRDLTIMLSALACFDAWSGYGDIIASGIFSGYSAYCTVFVRRDELRSHEPSPLQCYVRQVHRN